MLPCIDINFEGVNVLHSSIAYFEDPFKGFLSKERGEIDAIKIDENFAKLVANPINKI